MDNKTYLQYMISMNDFFRISNTNLVHSRINHLTELPVDELKMIIETEPLDVIKFNEIKMRINNIVDQNFELMMSPQNKMASIEQTIMLISQKEQDQEIINEVRNILYTQNDEKDYRFVSSSSYGLHRNGWLLQVRECIDRRFHLHE